MIDRVIKLTLILLFIFTPIAFGAMDFWAFSLMELGILFIVVLWAIQFGISPSSELRTEIRLLFRNPQSEFCNGSSSVFSSAWFFSRCCRSRQV